MDIPIYYDPMIAKLVVTADNREMAIKKMLRAIDEYQITGITTTLGFCKFVLNHEAFTSGNFDTKFVDRYFKPEFLNTSTEEDEQIAGALATMLMESEQGQQQSAKKPSKSASKWKSRLK